MVRHPCATGQGGCAEVLAVINASPFHVGKEGERVARMAERAQAVNLPLVYAHLVGGQDEVVFDGASFALQAEGSRALQADSFKEQLVFAHTERAAGGVRFVPDDTAAAATREPEAQLWDALVVGVRDYLGKNGFPGAILGLSGGIDSALVLAIAVDALGKDNVRAVMMPSPYTADISWIDAREMARRLGVRYDEISIKHHLRVVPRRLGRRVQGPARGHDRGKPPGAHPWHLADGAVQQVRLDRADDRQQERDGDRLLHAVRRHGGRFRRHQGSAQDDGVRAGPLAECARPLRPPARSPSPSGS